MPEEVVIVGAARTPMGSFRWSLSGVTARDLGAAAIKTALERAGVKPEAVEEVFMGNVLQANLGQNPARQAAIAAGIPQTVPATTVNKVCSSGMKAISLAAQTLLLGQAADVIVAGGMESMSNAPFYLPRGDLPYGGAQLIDGVLKDGLSDAYGSGHMGDCAEKTAKDFDLTREQQDKFAIESYKRAAAAWQSGRFKDEIVPVTVKQKRGAEFVVKEDEDYRKLNEKKLVTIEPAFQKDGGTVTAANSSSLNDGAAAVVLCTASRAKQLGLTPLAKIVAFADAAVAPVDFSIAPAKAVPKVLARAGLKTTDMDLFELNEAFSVTGLANMRELDIPHDKVNVDGGAVALGHPIGMSGARIVVHLAHVLKPGQKGCAAVCNGGGEASAMVIEKL